MGRVRAAILTATAIALLPVVGSEPVQALGPERTGVKIVREWTPKDSIPVRSFDPEEIKISPDGKFLFYINYHGDLSCDCDEYELVVFSLADINKALKNSRTAAQPYRRLLRRSSGDDTFAIYPAEWTSDSQNISFQGSDANGRRQYYEYNLPSGQVRALTSWDQEIDSLTHEKDTVVSNVWIDDPDAAPSRYPMYVMSRDDMSKTGVSVKAKARKLRTFVSFKGANPWQIKESDHLPGRRMYFSSDARQIVMLRRPTKNSTGWLNYDRLADPATSDEDRNAVMSFVLVDAASQSETLIESPTGLATNVGYGMRSVLAPRALWPKDEDHVVLVNASLPLGGKNSDAQARTKMAYVVDYDIKKGILTEIEPLEKSIAGKVRQIERVAWADQSRSQLLISFKGEGVSGGSKIYSLDNDRWVGRDAGSAQPADMDAKSEPADGGSPGLIVRLAQGANEPPHVVATNGKRTVDLTDPDPALIGLKWAKSKTFSWENSERTVLHGGLLLPSMSRSEKLPLVIQVFQYEPDRFRPDGPFRHVFAGQSLVARGFAVLTVNLPLYDTPAKASTPAELAEFRDRIETAVTALSERGLIDPDRVGLVGFSRGGFLIYHAITHPGRHPYAAAVIDDSFEGEYGRHLSFAATIGQPAPYEAIYGGRFWQNKTKWLDQETSFNVDRVKTPALFTLHGDTSASQAGETVGAFSLNRRPIEYVMYPRGSHLLHRPKERLASIQNTFDWMTFWLQGGLPEDKNLAARWIKLKSDWERQQAWEQKGNPVGSPPAADFVFMPGK